MTLPIRAAVSARRFLPEHQSRAALARHSRTELQRRAFECWLEQFWNNGTWPYSDVRRFISVIRRKIHRGDFAAQYTVTPNTLCDWLRSGARRTTNPSGGRTCARWTEGRPLDPEKRD